MFRWNSQYSRSYHDFFENLKMLNPACIQFLNVVSAQRDSYLSVFELRDSKGSRRESSRKTVCSSSENVWPDEVVVPHHSVLRLLINWTINFISFLKITYFLERILMEHIEMKQSLDSKLKVCSISPFKFVLEIEISYKVSKNFRKMAIWLKTARLGNIV